MSFSYDEEEGEISSIWCKSLNFVMTSSTFKKKAINERKHTDTGYFLSVSMPKNFYELRHLLTSLD